MFLFTSCSTCWFSCHFIGWVNSSNPPMTCDQIQRSLFHNVFPFSLFNFAYHRNVFFLFSSQRQKKFKKENCAIILDKNVFFFFFLEVEIMCFNCNISSRVQRSLNHHWLSHCNFAHNTCTYVFFISVYVALHCEHFMRYFNHHVLWMFRLFTQVGKTRLCPWTKLTLPLFCDHLHQATIWQRATIKASQLLTCFFKKNDNFCAVRNWKKIYFSCACWPPVGSGRIGGCSGESAFTFSDQSKNFSLKLFKSSAWKF